MVTSGSSSSQVLGRSAKNNQAGTSTCGTFPAPASGQTCLLSKAGPTSAIPVPTSCGHPSPVPPAMLPSLFIALLRVSPGGWWLSLVGLRIRPLFSGIGSCPPVSLWSLLAQLSLEEACLCCMRSACALHVLHVLSLPTFSPESGDQMSCVCVCRAQHCFWDSLSPCSAQAAQSCCQPAVELEEAGPSLLPGPAKERGK